MMYESEINNTMLSVLENRMLSIADCIQFLCTEGYIPNRNKNVILNWSNILIDAYQNINIFSPEQHTRLDNIYNKILKL